MDSYILNLDCKDEKGIVHKVTGVLYHHGLNVDDQAEFVDKFSNHFFMRTEVSGEIDYNQVIKDLQEVVPKNSRIRFHEKQQKDIVLLVTKEPHCLGDLLIRHAFGDLKARVLSVIGNHDDLQSLTEKFELPFHYIPHEGKSREEHEAEILEAIGQYNPFYIVLAKYMRVLTPSFINQYRYRIINIHHSFLPAFIGAKPYHQASERGVKIIGATAHFVTEKLDEGPIIAQDVIPTGHDKSIPEMIQAGRNVEKIVLANALKLVLEDRVFVHNRHTIIFD